MGARTTFDVRFWKIRVYKGKRGTTYIVRWTVAGAPYSKTYANAALADSARSELLSAAKKGVAFSTETGLPVVDRAKATTTVSWYDFVLKYVDMKWPDVSANNRKNIAKALVPATVAMLRSAPKGIDPVVLRTALREWAFNREQRDQAPTEYARVLRWVARSTRPVSALEENEVLSAVVRAMSSKLDGKNVAKSTAQRNRRILYNALEFAVRSGALGANPLKGLTLPSIQTSGVVDKRCLVNPSQTVALLDAIGQRPRGGVRLRPFFETVRYAGLRPEEALALRVHDVTLPEEGWGEILAHKATPEVGKQWTDSGELRDERHLKGRAETETRPVPVHPKLVASLREHIRVQRLKPGDLLFQGEGGDPLSGVVYRRAWGSARKAVLSPEQFASPLGKRVYDLRHTCLTEWLNAGVPPAQVAAWAGNSVAVLLTAYALCISGHEADLHKRIEAALSTA
ncbi:tyrosine-type recombinase/integrase [Embleya sp. NPDC050154]|uniref:tyrosine-type recombinase/integrase n=1 Tax=Embleya sp. NPDC050154 TaxID=3363988 RepID=UPI0037AECF74